VLVVWAAGCSSSGSGAPPADAPPSLPADVAAFQQDFCSFFGSCCATSRSACEGQVASAYRYNGYLRTFDAAHAKTCLDEVRGEASKRDVCRGLETIACSAVFKSPDAKPPPGEIAEAFCANTPDGDGHSLSIGDKLQCVALYRGKEGDPCIGTRLPGKNEWVGTTAPARVAMCFLDDGLFCSSTQKTCTKRALLGAYCEPPASTAGTLSCVDGAYCSIRTQKCETKKPLGATCGDNAGVSVTDECLAGDSCLDPYDGTGNFRCAATPASDSAYFACSQARLLFDGY
jgi:hypothetical protein